MRTGRNQEREKKTLAQLSSNECGGRRDGAQFLGCRQLVGATANRHNPREAFVLERAYAQGCTLTSQPETYYAGYGFPGIA